MVVLCAGLTTTREAHEVEENSITIPKIKI
jgi:hypothetical protein